MRNVHGRRETGEELTYTFFEQRVKCLVGNIAQKAVMRSLPIGHNVGTGEHYRLSGSPRDSMEPRL